MKHKLNNKSIQARIRLSEFKYNLKKKLNKQWIRFLEKGHEKMTVMFIPHNEKKIFNFQISKFIVLFFVALFLVVVATSSYALIKNRAIKNEEQRLLSTYNDIRSHLLRFEKMTNVIAEDIEEIKPEVEELYEMTAGKVSSDKIWSLEGFDSDLRSEKNRFKNTMPNEVFVLRELQRDLICTTNTIKTVRNFIDIRSKVVMDTPSIVPNHGHITSLFGWRRSPFGHGRDFHNGIDIAAASGTVIRATAPGKVVKAGWGQSYGYMVRVVHRYGYETIYAHMRAIGASVGQQVYKGTIIGYVGQTGNATGNHCHYEVRLGGVPVNPYPYMSRVW